MFARLNLVYRYTCVLYTRSAIAYLVVRGLADGVSSCRVKAAGYTVTVVGCEWTSIRLYPEVREAYLRPTKAEGWDQGLLQLFRSGGGGAS